MGSPTDGPHAVELFPGADGEHESERRHVVDGLRQLRAAGVEHIEDGAVTTYAYSSSAPWTTTATTNGRWAKTTLDGFGRTIKVESGYSTTTVSVVDTEYDSCGCTPIREDETGVDAAVAGRYAVLDDL